MRGRPRAGTLSDLDTLRAIEAGAEVAALAQHEGVSAHTILARARVARKERDKAVARHQAHAEAVVNRKARKPRRIVLVKAAPDPYGLAKLNRAIDALAAQEAAGR